MKFDPAKLKALIDADGRLNKNIADEGGFAPGSLTHWSTGARTPGANELAALARVFDVPVAYFYEGEEPAHRVIRDVPSEALVDDALHELEDVKEKMKSLERALQRLKTKSVSSKERLSEGQAIVKREGLSYDQRQKK